MPQDTPQPRQQPQTTTQPTPNIPTFRTNIPQKSFNKLIPVVIILAVLALAGLGTSIFFGIQNSSKSSEISDLKTQLSNQNPVVIVDDEEISETPSSPSDQPASQPNVVTKADILAEVPNNLSITSAKCLNCTADHNYNATATMGTSALSANINSANNLVSLQINWDALKQYYNGYSSLNISQTGFQSIDISLSSPVTDVFIARFGQATGDETVLFLMEDGTVEYIPIYVAIKTNDFRSYGKVPELKDIIKFYTGNSIATSAMTGGGYQTLAQRADGKFYELYTLLESTGNYDDSRWRQ